MTGTATSTLSVNDAQLQAVIQGTNQGPAMVAVAPEAVGASRLGQTRRQISVMVGQVGQSNGTLTLNMSERAMLFLAGKLLFEEQHEISDVSVDAIRESGVRLASRLGDEVAGLGQHDALHRQAQGLGRPR